jgi:hypothetical protein
MVAFVNERQEVFSPRVGGIRANKPFHVTAARLRFLLKPKGRIWAAARDRQR